MTRRRGTNRAPAVGVHVLGMHRSGTSATTRLINLMGVRTCMSGDHYSGVPWAETGLWESRTLVNFNDALLRRLGAAWWCPPRPRVTWIQHDSISRYLELGRKVFERLHTAGQWVWKDPRTCVTLPFWLRSLNVSPVGILVLRHPLEIAASLTQRNKFAIPLSLAMWERYLLNLVPHLQGLPVFVTRYDDVLANPVKWCMETAGFLVDHGVTIAGKWSHERVSEFVNPSLRHHRDGDERATSELMSPPQRELYDALLGAVGLHDHFESPVLPVETPSTDSLFAGMRQARGVVARATGPLLRFDQLRPRRPRQALRPVASIIVVNHNEGRPLHRAVDGLLRAMPQRVELIVVDDASTDGSAEFLVRQRRRVSVVRVSDRLGVAQARNLGARSAKGEIIIFCDARTIPADGWFAPLRSALSSPGVGAVGPALEASGKRSVKVLGLTFLDEVLNVGWLAPRGGTPYPVPLLPGCFLAVRQDVLHDANGFDEGFRGHGAADLELCMRLWRMGLECLVVPTSEVHHQFSTPRAWRANREYFLHNLLWLGITHLSSANLTRFLDALRARPDFDRAMARILVGDGLRRRAAMHARMIVDDTWFFRRFDMAAFGSQPAPAGVAHPKATLASTRTGEAQEDSPGVVQATQS